MASKDVRTLGRAFDALVRSARTHGVASEAAAVRVREAWQALDRAPLRFGAGDLRVCDTVTLGFDAGEVRWLLPAFMAGLRVVTPRDRFGVPDLASLAEAIARLEPEPSTIERFRDWLWGGGAAAGFEIELQTNIVEAGDGETASQTVSPEGALGGALSAVRGAGVETFDHDAVSLAAADVDHAAARDEFEAALETPAPGDAPAMHEALRAALRYRCDDPARWSLCEGAAIVAMPALQPVVPPEVLARRLATALRAHLDVDVVDLLASSVRRNDAYARRLMQALDDPDFPSNTVRALADDVEGHRVLCNLLAAAAPALATRIVHALLDAAATETHQVDIAVRVITSLGAARFIAMLNPAALRPPEAHALGSLLAEREGAIALLSPLMAKLPRPALPALLAALPLELRPEAAAALAPRWSELSGGFVESELAPLWFAAGEPGMRVLVDALAAQHGEGWSSESVRALGRALLSAGILVELCLPLIRSKKMATAARVALCDAAENHREAAAALSRWHPGELLDPPELRARLKSLREV